MKTIPNDVLRPLMMQVKEIWSSPQFIETFAFIEGYEEHVDAVSRLVAVAAGGFHPGSLIRAIDFLSRFEFLRDSIRYNDDQVTFKNHMVCALAELIFVEFTLDDDEGRTWGLCEDCIETEYWQEIFGQINEIVFEQMPVEGHA